MKVIDLLNKIANGEEVPKKIRINGCIYEYQGDDYLYIDENNDNHEYWLFSDGYTDKFQWLENYLRVEIEIVEEAKKIYKLGWIESNIFNKIQENSYLSRKEMELLDSCFKELGNKINEIIDYLNKENK